ncbi:hypothetical protein OH77DRAFT_1430958 [Trametes cingulata]|nr:hypothetical protein OH77DRAFT_1430958 [Trametes cingulata]
MYGIRGSLRQLERLCRTPGTGSPISLTRLHRPRSPCNCLRAPSGYPFDEYRSISDAMRRTLTCLLRTYAVRMWLRRCVGSGRAIWYGRKTRQAWPVDRQISASEARCATFQPGRRLKGGELVRMTDAATASVSDTVALSQSGIALGEVRTTH